MRQLSGQVLEEKACVAEKDFLGREQMICQPSHLVGLPLHGDQSEWVPRCYNSGRRTTLHYDRANLQKGTQQEVTVAISLSASTDRIKQRSVCAELGAYA